VTATLSQIDQLIEAARRHLDGLLALRADMAGEPGSEVETFTDYDFAPCNLIELPLSAPDCTWKGSRDDKPFARRR